MVAVEITRMKNNRLVWVVLLFLTFVQATSGESQRPLAFTHAVIIDGNGGAPIENGVLVVRGEKIEAVGPTANVQIPADAEVKDIGGKVIMPGLADMHVHFSHGWNGFAAQNSAQMVELASHGYVVAALQHTYGAMVTVFPDAGYKYLSDRALWEKKP